jgi:D-alanine--poly(phosphoribitol) ligase subunit 1
VAIQNEKTAFGFALMLACLKLGVIYTNFDPDNPKERLFQIFKTARPYLVVGDKSLTNDALTLSREIGILCRNYDDLDTKKEIATFDGRLSEQILRSVDGDSPAYIMFTSGSTGVPKGVLIRQSSLLNFVTWARVTYVLAEDDILTNVNPIYFDNSVFDFYCSLFNSLTMAAFSKQDVSQPKYLLEQVDNLGCTFWFSVPSFLIYLTNLKLLKPSTFQTIRTFAFGGEAYPKKLLQKLFSLYASRARFFNVYGPTEGTCICSAHQITPSDLVEDDSLVTLGRMADNFRWYILDEYNKPSSCGELILMGPQLALGYYNDPERTSHSFVPDPMAIGYQRLMYRTGDLVELKNNRFYFRGRKDNQIKHMGYRIELEEIEAGLIKVPYIKECAVVHGTTEAGFSRLAACVIIEGHPPEEKQIRADLRQYLPDYMIPGIFELMAELPKNSNGKINRLLLKQRLSLLS